MHEDDAKHSVDLRFERLWDEIEAERRAGKSLEAIISKLKSADLIIALAAAGVHDRLAANVIATHLLNRERRAPFLGAFLVSTTMLIAVYVTDFLVGGVLHRLTTGRLAVTIAFFSLFVATISGASFIMWRGGLPRIRAVVQRHRGHGGSARPSERPRERVRQR